MATEPPAEASPRLEWVMVGLLALAALATAWAGYQASLWDGIQSSDYTQAAAARTEATQRRTEANQFRLADLSLFENHIDAVIDGDTDVATFYRDRFRDEFTVAYDAWIALDPLENPAAPASPMAMSEYQLQSEAEAEDLEARAQSLFTDGEDANDISDAYTLSTLLFAVVLFLTAISERLSSPRGRTVLLVVAAAGFAGGLVVALSQPVTTG